jgi:predicted transcriptional regulator
MSIGKLILYPRDTESPPPQAETIIESLRSLGLIDRPMGSDTNRFLAGK